MKIFCTLLFCLFAVPSHAHEEERFSHSFVHPLEIHHAHNETEVKLNAAFREDILEESVNEETGETERTYKDVFENAFELAWATPDSRLGIETHIPFNNEGRDPQGGTVYGVGDIEIEPIRYSWIAEQDTVFTTSAGFILPTGDETEGSGEGKAFFEPHFLAEGAFGNWHLGANVISGFELGGEHEKTLGWGVLAAYTFGEEGQFLRALSLELAGESSLGGESEGEDTVFLTPGLHGQIGGREVRIGFRIPISEDREEARAYLVSVAV